MLKRFFVWLEDGIYGAIIRGCGRAARDLSDGDAVIDVSAIKHVDSPERLSVSDTAQNDLVSGLSELDESSPEVDATPTRKNRSEHRGRKKAVRSK